MTRDDLQKLSRVRLREAHTLLAAGEYSGAYYLAGYTVECALKACIASKTVEFEFPDRKRVLDAYSHSLVELVRVAGLADRLVQQVTGSLLFAEYWQVAREWSEASRYRLVDSFEAARLVNAIADPKEGVLLWVQRYW